VQHRADVDADLARRDPVDLGVGLVHPEVERVHDRGHLQAAARTDLAQPVPGQELGGSALGVRDDHHVLDPPRDRGQRGEAALPSPWYPRREQDGGAQRLEARTDPLLDRPGGAQVSEHERVVVARPQPGADAAVDVQGPVQRVLRRARVVAECGPQQRRIRHEQDTTHVHEEGAYPAELVRSGTGGGRGAGDGHGAIPGR
jgi:hypothetical protein